MVQVAKPMFWGMGFHFQKPQIDLKAKNWLEGCRRSRRTSRRKMCTWGVIQLRHGR